MRKLLPLVLCLIGGCGGCQRAETRVVVYSAQDQEFAEAVFVDFEKETQLKLQPKFDTEANKSVSLVSEIELEQGRPRCDVHWNNEILGTIRLARQGAYEAYVSPNAADFPTWSRGKGSYFQAFAERARVLIVNTNLVRDPERPNSIFDLTSPKWKGQICMAKPNFGTTATHAASLFECLGPVAAKMLFKNMKANEVQILPGNKQVATSVSAGRHAFGITDTDDAILEVLAGKPVAIVFPDATGHAQYPRLGTLFIPNTLAIVKGCPNLVGAKKLVDFLLKPETERKLASGGGYQFPLNPSLKDLPHPALRTRLQVNAQSVDWEKAADYWEECQEFLRNEFAR